VIGGPPSPSSRERAAVGVVDADPAVDLAERDPRAVAGQTSPDGRSPIGQTWRATPAASASSISVRICAAPVPASIG
jgi:hypothetical protein